MGNVVVGIALLFSITACSSLWPPVFWSDVSEPTEQPKPLVPTPGFPGIVTGFVSTPKGYRLVSEMLCVYINQEAYWEPGDFWEAIRDYPRVKIAINGQQVSNVEFTGTGPGIAEYSKAGRLLGTHGDTFRYCLKPKLTSGAYSITVRGTTTSGRVHSYSWKFYVSLASAHNPHYRR